MFQNYEVSYSFRTASGEVAHHTVETGGEISPEIAIANVLQSRPKFVRDNLVSSSAKPVLWVLGKKIS